MVRRTIIVLATTVKVAVDVAFLHGSEITDKFVWVRRGEIRFAYFVRLAYKQPVIANG